MAITPEQIEESRQAAIRRLTAAARVLGGRPFEMPDEEILGIVRDAMDAQRVEEADRRERIAARTREAATSPPGSATAALIAAVRDFRAA